MAVALLLTSAGSAGAQIPGKTVGLFVSNRIDLAAEAGFTTVQKDVWVNAGYRWKKDLPSADRDQLDAYLKYARAHQIGVVLNLWQVNWVHKTDPPNKPNKWSGTCNVVNDIMNHDITDARDESTQPAVVGVVIGVEPNSRHFWEDQANAPVVDERWLARCYDVIKPWHQNVPIYGGSLASRAGPGGTGPGAFITGMCQAYKQSGRVTPIMDGWDQHSYENEAPTTSHPASDVITIGDYAKLESLLSCFGQGPMPILWGEIGYDSRIPAAMGSRYSGKETTGAVDEATQGAWYAKAIQMVYCSQPLSQGLFIFHADDDPALSDWQSGLFYTNPNRQLSGIGGYTDVAKSSLGLVQAARDASSCP